jgi:hypothetical protein
MGTPAFRRTTSRPLELDRDIVDREPELGKSGRYDHVSTMELSNTGRGVHVDRMVHQIDEPHFSDA